MVTSKAHAIISSTKITFRANSSVDMNLDLAHSISHFMYFPFLLVLCMYFFLILLKDISFQLLFNSSENKVSLCMYDMTFMCSSTVKYVS